jgi:hypothetical protein
MAMNTGLLLFHSTYSPLGGDVAVGRSTGVGRRRGSATGVEGLGGDGARVGTACTLGFPER